MTIRQVASWEVVIKLLDKPSLINTVDLSVLDGIDIARLVRENPNFIDKLDITKMNEVSRLWVLEKHPTLINRLKPNGK